MMMHLILVWMFDVNLFNFVKYFEFLTYFYNLFLIFEIFWILMGDDK